MTSSPVPEASSSGRLLSSVTNALSALSYLAEVGEAGVSEVSRYIGVTVATGHRLVKTLVATGWAEQNLANRKYRPSQKLLILAQKIAPTIDAREVAHRFVTELVQKVNETGNLGILDAGQVLYVDKVVSERPVAVEVRIGSRIPVYCTALGKVLVASLDRETSGAVLAKALSTARRQKVSPAPPDLASARAEIERVRLDGYALDLGEYLPDVCCVAAPVHGRSGVVVAAISVSAPRSRFVVQRDELVEQVQLAASALSDAFSSVGIPGSPTDLIPLRITRTAAEPR